MDVNRFTEKSQEALRAAQAIAQRRSHQAVDVEHILTALLGDSEGIACRVLEKAGADPAALLSQLDGELGKVPQVTGPGSNPDQIYVSPRLGKLLQAAEDES